MVASPIALPQPVVRAEPDISFEQLREVARCLGFPEYLGTSKRRYALDAYTADLQRAMVGGDSIRMAAYGSAFGIGRYNKKFCQLAERLGIHPQTASPQEVRHLDYRTVDSLLNEDFGTESTVPLDIYNVVLHRHRIAVPKLLTDMRVDDDVEREIDQITHDTPFAIRGCGKTSGAGYLLRADDKTLQERIASAHRSEMAGRSGPLPPRRAYTPSIQKTSLGPAVVYLGRQ